MSLSHPSPVRKAKNSIAVVVMGLAFVVACIPLVSILWTVVAKGAKDFDVYFLFHSMRNVAEQQSNGGAYHAILGTLEQVGIAAVITIPLSLLVAIYLVEYGRGRLAKSVTFFVDVMMGLPSIVAGLFILSFWILGLGFKASGFAASLALLILMMPIAIRSTEEMLRLVSPALREASYALGVSKWRTIVKVVLPTALPGIVTGMMLGVARIMGETAPVLLLVGVSESINPNPFNQPQGSLPLFVFSESQNSLQTAIDRGWAAALTLIILVMLLNLIARLIAWWKAPAAAR
ncbi:phosphate ABC transporter permease PstA [Actinospica sp.]|jgi:phosphate transport system permease protein|uniref:phosphate ABC transporter permease PstA n=1 Tax=Actinospica sp. TaxID=1872142 RepID=UPI002C93D7D5|nr:phosphate ABC transporter permease PstA [Actinospica sp.]HWG22688.1 phosphate ABC transporter permease PstA [Actinospica sp.]